MLNELYTIDIEYFKSKKNSENFNYLKSFLEINKENSEKILINLYNSINSIDDLSKKFINFNKEYSKILAFLKIDYKKFCFIKSDNDLIKALIAFFLLKSFTNKDSFKFEKIEDGFDFDEQLIPNESDSIINNCVSLFEKLKMWLEIHYLIEENSILNKKDLRLVYAWILLEISKNENCLLKEKKLPKLNKFKYYYLNSIYDLNLNFELSKIQYKYQNTINNYIIYSYHYTTINYILKENSRSSFTISKSESITNFLNTILPIGIYISNERLFLIIEELCKKNNIDINNIEKDYRYHLDLYIESLDKNKEIRSTLSKLISVYLKIINLLNIYKNNDGSMIYISPMLCFRGRIYYISTCSLTFHKELRYCSFLGWYENEEKEQDNNIFLFKNYYNDLNKLNLINKELDDSKKEWIIWVLISIAEIWKSEKMKWTISDFLNKAINAINNYQELNISLEDKIKLDYYIFVIKEIIKDSKQKWLVSKDATASVFQHAVKALGILNEESLILCNLNSNDTWYDTYAYIIEKWKNETNWSMLELIYIKNYFNRKNLKGAIMTNIYGSKLKNAFKKFIKSIEENNANYLSEIDIRIIEKIFKNFYIFLDNGKFLLAYSSIEMREEIINNHMNLKTIFNEEINLIYFKKKIRQIEIKINKKRISKQEIIISSKLDSRKIKSSARANYIQSMDAALARWFSLNMKSGFSIHDCFLVDYKQITKLIFLINEGMKIQFHTLKKINFDLNTIFSTFILL